MPRQAASSYAVRSVFPFASPIPQSYILPVRQRIPNSALAGGVREAEVAWSRHHQGACRMGTNPRSSVVDRDLRVHESPNLYVCGSEVFSTGGAMQPSLSIAALSLRLADHLTERLKSGA